MTGVDSDQTSEYIADLSRLMRHRSIKAYVQFFKYVSRIGPILNFLIPYFFSLSYSVALLVFISPIAMRMQAVAEQVGLDCNSAECDDDLQSLLRLSEQSISLLATHQSLGSASPTRRKKVGPRHLQAREQYAPLSRCWCPTYSVQDHTRASRFCALQVSVMVIVQFVGAHGRTLGLGQLSSDDRGTVEGRIMVAKNDHA